MDIWFTLAKYLSCQPPNEHLVSNPSDFDAFMSNFYRTYVRAFEWSMEQVVLVCSLPASNGLAKQHAVAWFLTELLIAVCGIKKNIFFSLFCVRFIPGVLTKCAISNLGFSSYMTVFSFFVVCHIGFCGVSLLPDEWRLCALDYWIWTPTPHRPR